MEGHVALLRQAVAIPPDDLLSDDLRFLGVLYALQCAIEGLVNVSHHVIAEANLRLPGDNPQIAAILAEGGVITDADLIAQLPRMIRFRNLLVHRYWQIDRAVVLEILQHRLGEFEAFAREVERWLVGHPEA